MTPKGFDLFALPENERIRVIGKAARTSVVGFFVETDAKADRYIGKLTKRFPSVRVIDRGPGPVPNTILVRCGPKPESLS